MSVITMEKRDRFVVLYLHRSTKNVLLFPDVCFMAGQGSAYGDAVELVAPVEPASAGKQTLRLLRAVRKADLDEMKARHTERLRRSWRGEPPLKEVPQGITWTRLLSSYPGLAKGPGTYLRQFSVCQLVERDGWKFRKMVRVVSSQYRGCTGEGDCRRIPIDMTATQLGQFLIESMSASE
ncbi:MAG: hypothetical protein FJ271_03035 [Planctomycetes bacterium]|nr:hypothetical protein [Planctomycetota bacterium]